MKNVALITGASSGIGREFAIIHAQKGGDLVLVARRGDKLEEIKRELEREYGVEVKVLVQDLSRSEGCQWVYDELKREGIEVEYLINNAGFGEIGYFHEGEWANQSDMIQLNIVALTHLTHLFLPDFVKRGGGYILNVSSIASLLPGPLLAVYYASKAYVTSFSQALAGELEGTNVRVTALLPGPTASEFGAVSGADKTQLLTKPYPAFGVAQDGYNAMLKGKLTVLSGVSLGLRMMMKLIPFLPTRVVLRATKRMQETK